MAANNAFTLLGATPQQSPSFGLSGSTPVAKIATPASNALNRAYSGTDSVITNNPASVFARNANLTPSPTTPVKSVATNVDGSTKTEYHKPDAQSYTLATGSNPSLDNPQSNSTPSPLKGVITLPNGTTVNADTGETLASSAPTYSGLVGQLASTATQNTGIGQRAADIANRYGQEYADVGRKGANAESGYLTTGTSPVAEGNAAVQVQNTAAQQEAIAKGEEAALQGTGQQLTAQNQTQSGLNNAANLAQPQVGAYGQTYYNPLTAGQSGQSAEVAATDPFYQTLQQYAQMAANGQLSEVPASVTGNAVLNAQLNRMATTINPSYNPVLSQASAGTQQTGQQLQTAANSANQALDTLSTSFSSLPSFQTGGIPLTNSIANWIASQGGESALTAYKTALSDARSQLVGALNASGGTPTGNEATAMQYLPDNMTGEQFNQNVGTVQNPGIVRQLLQQKVDSFTKSGQQNQNGTTSTSATGWL